MNGKIFQPSPRRFINPFGNDQKYEIIPRDNTVSVGLPKNGRVFKFSSAPLELPRSRTVPASNSIVGNTTQIRQRPSRARSITNNSSKRNANTILEKKKHGSYKIWHRNASEELQEAYNSIYGLPLYGSVCFIAQKGAARPMPPAPPPSPAIPNSASFQSKPQGQIHPQPRNEPQKRYVHRPKSIRRSKNNIMTETRVVQRFNGKALLSAEIPLGGLKLHVVSGGKDDGDSAEIIINGTDYSLNGRGLNIVAILGDLRIQQATFDTHGVPEEAEKLSTFLKSLPPHTYIIGAVRDDAAKFLGQVGRDALRSIGCILPKADDGERLRAVVGKLPRERTRVLMTVCAKADAKNCSLVLLENGWDIHTRAAHTNNTPLHDAVYQNNCQVVLLLMDNKADQTLKNKWGETPADIAWKKHGYSSLEELVMSSNAHIKSVMRFIGLD